MYKRIILKISGEALANSTDCFNDAAIRPIISQIKALHEKNVEVAVIVGGGNFWRGRSAKPDMDRCRADEIGMLATVMNAVYIVDFLQNNGVDALVMTPFTVGNISELFSKQAALRHLSSGRVIVFAGGIGHPFFSTDTVTALRAAELEADAILYAKSIDGVYDSDPSINPSAKKYDTIECKKIIEDNLRVIDTAAASLCYEQKIPVVIFGLSEENGIVRAAEGEKIGTTVTV